MKRVALTTVIAALTLMVPAAAAQNQPVSTPATPENITSFLGEWTINASGSYGNATLQATLKVADGKVAGEVSDTNGKHAMTDVWRSGTSIGFAYVFDYQGMPINTVVTLTPNDKQVDAMLDFANGAAQFVGTATKK
jgi:hypothetical protein